MLAFLDNTTWAPWTNQPRTLNGEGSYQLPRNAETVYSDEELAAYGLYRVTPAEVPDGKRVVSTAIEDHDGRPVEVLTLEDVPPPTPSDYPLTMRQLRLGLVYNGFPVDFIQQAIAAIPDATERAVATIWYEESTTVHWDHPMTQTLMAAAGISPEQAATMWLAAKDLEA